MVISENCCNFIVLKYKELQTIIAMITEDKVTELFCMADDFCKFFDAMMEKYTLKSNISKSLFVKPNEQSQACLSYAMARNGRIYTNLFQRLFVDGIHLITKLKNNMKGALMSVSDKLLLRKRAIIETVNDELKNIAQVEHSRHRCFDNFIVNLLGAIAAYCMFSKKPCINVQRTVDTRLSLF